VSTKYGRRQNLDVKKILASTKSWHRQEAGADKMVAQTKCWRRRGRIPLLFGSAESTAADFSQTSLKIFACSRQVWRCLQPPRNSLNNSVYFSISQRLRWKIQKKFEVGYGITFQNHRRLPECRTKHSKEGSKTLLGKHRQVSHAFSLRTCQRIQKFWQGRKFGCGFQ
jgi:hypothetical protein